MSATAYLVSALLLSWAALIIALGALYADRKEIKSLKSEKAKQSNSLREKGCEINRLEKTIENFIKNRGRRI